jgi:predicted MFS family arabinose efflux permease
LIEADGSGAWRVACMTQKAVFVAIDRHLINRDFAKLWYGQAISSVGDFVFTTTLTLWIAVKLGAGQSWAPAAIGGLLIAATAAIVIVGPVAGVLVDRWDRRQTMLRTEAVRAVLAALLALISLVPQHDLPIGGWLVLVYVVVFALNAAGRFFGPAQMVTISRVVPGIDNQTKAFGVANATNAVARMIGPPLAAPLLFSAGVTWALAFNAASYVVSYYAIRTIDLPPAPATPPNADVSKVKFWREMADGARVLVRNKVIVGILVCAMVCQVGVGALNTLDVFFVTENLHVAAKNFGYMAVAMGVGLILGSLIAPRVVRKLGPATTTTCAMLAAGVIYAIYARQTTFAAGLAVLLLFEVPVAVVATSMEPILLAAVPRAFYARVMSAFGTLNQGTLLLSMALSGWIASSALHDFHGKVLGVHVGAIDTILTLAALAIVLGGAVSKITIPSNATVHHLAEQTLPTAADAAAAQESAAD